MAQRTKAVTLHGNPLTVTVDLINLSKRGARDRLWERRLFSPGCIFLSVTDY